MIEFNVLGVPAPQGSKTRMPNGAMIEGSSTSGRAKLKSWRTAVAEAAREAAEHGTYDGPLRLCIVFRFATPRSRKKADRSAWTPHMVKPDLSKIIRATEDALTDAGLIVDDARICTLWVRKFEVPEGEWTGAEIIVSRELAGQVAA